MAFLEAIDPGLQGIIRNRPANMKSYWNVLIMPMRLVPCQSEQISQQPIAAGQ